MFWQKDLDELIVFIPLWYVAQKKWEVWSIIRPLLYCFQAELFLLYEYKLFMLSSYLFLLYSIFSTRSVILQDKFRTFSEITN